ncbi:MAG: HIT family protein [Candidatus Poseidoniales archaeon]
MVKNTVEQTLFERIISGEIPGNFIARGDDWSAFLDVFPRRQGHTLVVPHRPVKRLIDLSSDELPSLMEGIQITQGKLKAFFGNDDFSIVLHDGPLAGQEIPHLHFHVIPREKGDGGQTLLSMWPEVKNNSEPDFLELAKICSAVEGANL